MYGDQFGEFVCGHWGLKGQETRLRQTSVSSSEFLRIETKQTKTVQNNSYG